MMTFSIFTVFSLFCFEVLTSFKFNWLLKSQGCGATKAPHHLLAGQTCASIILKGAC